jgi:hypothetical protein
VLSCYPACLIASQIVLETEISNKAALGLYEHLDFVRCVCVRERVAVHVALLTVSSCCACVQGQALAQVLSERRGRFSAEALVDATSRRRVGRLSLANFIICKCRSTSPRLNRMIGSYSAAAGKGSSRRAESLWPPAAERWAHTEGLGWPPWHASWRLNRSAQLDSGLALLVLGFLGLRRFFRLLAQHKVDDARVHLAETQRH